MPTQRGDARCPKFRLSPHTQFFPIVIGNRRHHLGVLPAGLLTEREGLRKPGGASCGTDTRPRR
jgi:hypothetical protein